MGLRPRRAHDLRRTFISNAQRGKCNREALKACTHGSKGDIVDEYTTWAWEDLGAAISCVAFTVPSASRQLRLASLDPVATRQGSHA